jgi:transposase
MTEYRDIIRRLRDGMGPRAIQRDTGIHRTIIRSLRGLAEVEGWIETDKPLPSEEEIHRVRSRASGTKENRHPLYVYLEEFRGWVKEGYSYVVMYNLIKDRHPCSEPTVRRFVQKYLPNRPKPVMVRPTVPGRDMEVDFGYLGITYDPQARRNRRTYIFSGRLRHSRLAYREATFNQKADAFFQGHMHAFEYFDGVPEKAVPDNLKAAVITASYQEPIVNRVYHQLAEHYGFLINPCPPYDPRKKGGVENDIKYVKGNFWPLFKEKQKALGRSIPHHDDLVRELARWTKEVSETRKISGVGRSPREIFESEERLALKSLPTFRWDSVSWGQPIAGPDFLVQFEKAFYSVPYQCIGEQLVALGNRRTVRIFQGIREIACHERAESPWQIVRNPLHAPPYLEEYMNTTSAGLVSWAFRLGDSVGHVAQSILADKVVDGMRPTRALIRLEKKYGVDRLERACARALRYDTASYQSVSRILSKKLDELPAEDPTEPSGQKVFRFQRQGRDYEPALSLVPLN